MSHDRTVVDVRHAVYDFDMNRGYYDTIGSRATGRLANQDVEGHQHGAAGTDASKINGTLLKWYVTGFLQSYTGTASDGSESEEVSGPSSDDESDAGSVQSRAENRGRPGRMGIWVGTAIY